ncbi:hypothetical protein HF086_011410 [Spodoptera exigua]|uniref:Uncharacterized protein n=1 Tax=Spodoptera exigua TaxID=7107 RepID=A0A922STK8_SPOEX|nr:hypothetical protein HF086_011410 [Spodoptera exigua]
MLTKTCEEWGFNTDKVTAVVTDNAANMVKAVEIAFGKKKHIPCFAHTLNLVAQHILGIPELQEILTKAKNVVTFFKESCVASDELRKSVRADTKLIQDVPTRWNSTYYMIARFLDLRNAVSEILIRHKTAPPMLTGMELTILTSLLNVLQPLEAATKEISGDKYYSSSKIIPLVHCMISKLKNLVIEESLIKDVQKRTLTEINKRMGAIEQVLLEYLRIYCSSSFYSNIYNVTRYNNNGAKVPDTGGHEKEQQEENEQKKRLEQQEKKRRNRQENRKEEGMKDARSKKNRQKLFIFLNLFYFVKFCSAFAKMKIEHI